MFVGYSIYGWTLLAAFGCSYAPGIIYILRIYINMYYTYIHTYAVRHGIVLSAIDSSAMDSSAIDSSAIGVQYSCCCTRR